MAAEREQTEQAEVTPAVPEAVTEAVPATLGAGPMSGFGAAMGFGKAGATAPRPRLTPGQVIQLQRSVGNAQTSALIARLVDGMEPAGADADTRSNEQIAKDAIDKKDVGDAKHVKLRSSGYAGINGGDKYKLIQILTDQGWVGPVDETALEMLWNSYGPVGIVGQYEADGGVYFEKGIKAGANLYEISAVKQVTTDFEADVKNTALSHLLANSTFVGQEMERLGIGQDPRGAQGGAAEGKERQDKAEERLKEIQILAVQAKRAEEAKAKLLDTKVGYNMVASGPHDREGNQAEHEQPASFTPGGKPEKPPKPGDLDGGMRTWEDVNEDFKIVMAVITGLGLRSPALYAAMARGKTADLADPAKAKETATEALLDTKTKIAETTPKITSGDLDWRDLSPIHQQLFSGRAGGTRDWSKGLNQSVAKAQLQGHEDTQFWVTLGLSSLAAAAFVISELATGGLATAAWAGVGIGIGAGQAAMSWEKYEDMATAAGATASDDLAVISKGQADAALIAAVLDTVFAAIDVVGAAWGPAKAALKAEKILGAGAEKAGVAALRDLGSLANDVARREAIQKGLQEVGLEGVVKQSGKTAEELAVLVGRDTAEGKKLLAFAESAGKAGEEGAEAAADQMRTLKALEPGEKEAAVMNALDRFGPAKAMEMAGGYDEIVKALGNNSDAAKRLMTWRNGVEAELKEYMEGQLKSTGRRGMASNDMDMSSLGKGATEAREEARTWLAGRLGVDPGSVEALVGGQLFTDPRRLHIYEGLPAATRELIDKETNKAAIEASQNMRLAEAIKNGDEALQAQIREQMSSMGLKETKIAKLSPGERLRLGHEIDELHGQLNEALAKGEPADHLARQISERQGLINANEPGAYLSGGGGRANVTGRPDDPLFPEYAPGQAGSQLSPSEAAARMFEEQRMLDDALHSLHTAGDPADVAKAIKKVGKYGSRQSGTAGMFAGAGKLDALTAEFKALQKAAETGGVTEATVKATVERANKALDQLAGEVESNLATWAKQAGAASGPELAAIQARIIWGMNFKAALRGAKRQYATAARMVRMGLDPGTTGVPSTPEAPPQ